MAGRTCVTQCPSGWIAGWQATGFVLVQCCNDTAAVRLLRKRSSAAQSRCWTPSARHTALGTHTERDTERGTPHNGVSVKLGSGRDKRKKGKMMISEAFVVACRD